MSSSGNGGELSRFEEMHGPNTNMNKPVDGTEVGNPQQEQIAKNLEIDKDKESNKSVASIEDMNKTLKKNKEQLADAALKNPDMLSAVEKGPGSQEEAKNNLEVSLNSVV